MHTNQPFQQFVAKLLQQKPIKVACANLYSSLQMNPNLLLFCCWYGASGAGLLKRTDLLKAIALLDKWHTEITRRLYTLSALVIKKQAGEKLASLYNEILRAQALAEQTEQNILFNILATHKHPELSHTQRLADAKANIVAYTKLLNRQLQDAHYQQLKQLLESVFADMMTLY